MDENKIIAATIKLLDAVGVDQTDANFQDTPKRVARAYKEMLEGQDVATLNETLQKIFKSSFPSTYKGMVIARNVKAIGMCPHHLLPITYNIDIVYISDRMALGLSKMARVARLLAKRLTLQETLTQDIADAFMTHLNVKGVMVVVKGTHGCMKYRGIKEDSMVITSSIAGLFETDFAARQEALALIANGK